MFFRPRFSTKEYTRRGIRPRGNTLVLLFVFFLIGLFLHYGGRTQPVVAFWNDTRELIGLGHSRPDRKGSNPYKAPEPDNPSDVATDNGPGRESEASDNAPSQRLRHRREMPDSILRKKLIF